MKSILRMLLICLSLLPNKAHSDVNPKDLFFSTLVKGMSCVPQSPFIASSKVMIIHSLGWQNGGGVVTATNIPVTMDTVDDRKGSTNCTYPLSDKNSPSFLVSCRSVFPNSELVLDSIISISKDLKTAEVREYSPVIGGDKSEPSYLSLNTTYKCTSL